MIVPVRVLCRFRPLCGGGASSVDVPSSSSANSEVGDNHEILPDGLTVRLPDGRHYAFDGAFGPSTQQETIYQQVALPVVSEFCKGFNATILCYGQTGAGKSHSMFGSTSRPGIIPRVASAIFESLCSAAAADEVAVQISFLEIYNETLRDLFTPSPQTANSSSLKIRQTPLGDVFVQNLSSAYVTTPTELLRYLVAAERHRSVASTAMNLESSRSHSVFTISMAQKCSDGSSKSSKLHLVDLAGSERIEKAKVDGANIKETQAINQSLAALGNVINALCDSKRSHVPFRNSTLTMLLKDSLGGNTKTSLLLCCSSDRYNLNETISTLEFGKRAKTIKSRVRINETISNEKIIEALRKEIEGWKLKCKLLDEQRLNGGKDGVHNAESEDDHHDSRDCFPSPLLNSPRSDLSCCSCGLACQCPAVASLRGEIEEKDNEIQFIRSEFEVRLKKLEGIHTDPTSPPTVRITQLESELIRRTHEWEEEKKKLESALEVEFSKKIEAINRMIEAEEELMEARKSWQKHENSADDVWNQLHMSSSSTMSPVRFVKPVRIKVHRARSRGLLSIFSRSAVVEDGEVDLNDAAIIHKGWLEIIQWTPLTEKGRKFAVLRRDELQCFEVKVAEKPNENVPSFISKGVITFSPTTHVSMEEDNVSVEDVAQNIHLVFRCDSGDSHSQWYNKIWKTISDRYDVTPDEEKGVVFNPFIDEQ